ncbi:hypothetical protein [Vreelandella alkaliphila]|uniref:Uncharacterized protein n=1 Tax=Vreelandella alkaliphila TaxID=272774 RepID=A0AAJ2S585_9GAMM|nr:hypothetical protein [Halomonas alkaliphila]MDX5979610.1 hypothetical protein [Halomonas alkaliphila]
MKLEKTILDVTAQRLRELKCAAEKRESGEMADSMRDFFTLIELSKIQDSGLSDDAVLTMRNMEGEALKATNEALEAMRVSTF